MSRKPKGAERPPTICNSCRSDQHAVVQKDGDRSEADGNSVGQQSHRRLTFGRDLGNAAQQEARLKELSAKLPKSAKEAEALPKLAGKLNAPEMEALEYFLAQRYQIK